MKMFRFVSTVAAGAMAIALAAASGTAAAQQKPAPAGYKVGFVDMTRVLGTSRASRDIQQRLEAELQKRTKEIEAGPKADVERRKMALAGDMNLRRGDMLKQFIDRINGIIRRIAIAEKYDAVFVEAIYVDVQIDITDKVIKELDAGR
jgi:outer membrane protein